MFTYGAVPQASGFSDHPVVHVSVIAAVLVVAVAIVIVRRRRS